MATGSEVSLIVDAGMQLANGGVGVRLVSFPSWGLFDAQDKEYQDSVLLPEVKPRLAVEAGIAQGWHRWVGDGGDVISIERYGASAPYKIIFEKYGLTVKNVIQKAQALLKVGG
jgi:transketolase